jgi:hypothetical protein
VVGNPPYQEETESDSTRALPIYNEFMDGAYKIADRVILVTPARFLFNAGYTPKSWNEKMLNDRHFKIVCYEQDSSKFFKNTSIIGGVAISYRDVNADFGAIEVFTVFPELNDILKKVWEHNPASFSNLIYGQLIYQYTRKLTEDFPDKSDITIQNGKYLFRTNAFDKFREIFFDSKPNDGYEYIQMLGLQGNKRIYKWVRRDYISEHESLAHYKVFISAANGASGTLSDTSARMISTPLLGEPFVGTTQTFLTVGSFNNTEEARAALKYVRSKFARALLGVLKVTQHNTSEKWRYVPLQDFTPQSDIDWTKPIPEIDKQLYAKYGLNENEIAFIEEKVTAME